jgi:hypothetical protein
MKREHVSDTTSRILAASRAILARQAKSCGANAQGGGGFQRGNTCARGSGKETQLELWEMMEEEKPAKANKVVTHEETIDSHVSGNVAMAIDQADAYGGLQGALDSFYQNTVDSVIEDGYTAEEAMDAGLLFIGKFKKATGFKEGSETKTEPLPGDKPKAESRHKAAIGNALLETFGPDGYKAAYERVVTSKRFASLEALASNDAMWGRLVEAAAKLAKNPNTRAKL